MTAARRRPPPTAAEEIEHGLRSTNTHLAEAVSAIAVHAPGDLLVSGFLPHHERVVIEGMRLTRQRCEDAITVLQAVLVAMEQPCRACGRTRP